MICVFMYLMLASWYNNCLLILSSPHDFCMCIKNMNVFLQDENGNPDKWLKINKHKVVQEIYPVAANTNYMCQDVRIGDMFHVVKNGSWFCNQNEFTVVHDKDECYG